MENIDRVLQKFINSSDGEFIVTDTLWKILFKSGVIDIDTEKWERWVRLYKDDPTDGLDMDWEIADKDSGTYYKAYTKEVSVEDSRYLVHHVIDVSDYAEIFQDLSAYSRMAYSFRMSEGTHKKDIGQSCRLPLCPDQ